ncbi:hypothetical protein L249_6901 [Ophiocordyceps polyrhachis-furcata BCC 54312]|uniref:Cytochrome c oxidase copper chaperone n=1 Tax=Ophiocordyceps polyrhachis-furcata BCC 54312 TaxID=1330021 RepID=A0A367LLL5_9HYPO|nr:hypothetical protein L249_6901 [Ophiocordyceps polyrhachis-furcata BCC 54312]
MHDAKASPPKATTPAHHPSEEASSSSSTRPKPCCVCKEEKSKRDECMLFSTAKDPAAECSSFVDQYRSCMLRYGFTM